MRGEGEGAELPGGNLLAGGLRDLREGRDSVPGLLLEVARARLARLGIDLPARGRPAEEAAELRLYRLLQREVGDDAYAQYNAWLRRLASLCHALEARDARARRGSLAE